jgi:hypothetical protein
MDWVSEIVFGKIFGFIDGYKSYLFGLYLILKGFFGLCGHYWPDVGYALPVTTANNYIEAGVAAFCAKSAIAKTASVK